MKTFKKSEKGDFNHKEMGVKLRGIALDTPKNLKRIRGARTHALRKHISLAKVTLNETDTE